jgi:hypothetical protein
MFFSSWFIVAVVLFVILFALFMAFITWLVHSLEGYPAFAIRNANRRTSVVPASMTIQSAPESSPVLSMFSDCG